MMHRILTEIKNNDLKSLFSLKIKNKIENLVICPNNIFCLVILSAGLEIEKKSKNQIKITPKDLIVINGRISDDMKSTLLLKIPMNRLGTGEDVSNTVVFLSSELTSYITGETIHVNGGMYMAWQSHVIIYRQKI